MKRRISVVLVAISLLAVISVAAVAQQGKVVLYTSVPLELATRFSAEFEKVNRNIKVEVFRAGSTDVVNKIWAENEAGGVRADVIWLADAAAYYTMKDRGLLLKYVSPEAASIPADLKDPDGFFTGARIINMIIGINTNMVRDRSTVRTWNQLLALGRRAAMADPLYSGSNFLVTATFVKTHGNWGWFETARKNNVQVLRGNADVARGLAAGEFAAAMVLDYMVFELKQQGAPVDIIWPDDGTISIPSPVAITASSKDQASAKAFVDFVLSKRGQELMVRDGILPVRGDVPPPAGMPTADKIKFMPIPFTWAAENTTMIRETYERVMTSR